MTESTLARLRASLNRGDSWLTYDLNRLLVNDGLDDRAIEELETRLLGADAGVEATQFLSGRLRLRVRQGKIRDAAALKDALKTALLELLSPCAQPLVIPPGLRPFVLLVVGVNGVGKTTTLGKLALRLKRQGHSVVLAAGDTFRAAATEQLQVWAERSGAPLISQRAGAAPGASAGGTKSFSMTPASDSASVIFDAIQSAKTRGTDVVIADTAGRLHTQSHLMDELRKIKRVIGKTDPRAPHEVLLVLDATTGANALKQAQQFHQALGVTGLVLTKLDGSARGGTLLAIARTLALPIRFIGIGEGVEDLIPFDAETYADALIA